MTPSQGSVGQIFIGRQSHCVIGLERRPILFHIIELLLTLFVLLVLLLLAVVMEVVVVKVLVT